MKKVLLATFIAVGFGCIGGFGSKANLAWGSQIAFMSNAFNPDGEIIIINSDGTVPQPVKGLPHPTWPTCSPNGKKIAFIANIADAPRQLYLMDANGRNLQPLRRVPLRARPVWHPDGHKIAFADFEELIVFDLETNTSTRVFFHPRDNGLRDPAWSPTGTHISFWLVGDFKVGVMRADGEDRQILFRGAYPSWKPDGSAAVDPVEKLPVAWVQVKLGL